MDQGPRPDPEYLANSFWLPGRADLWGGYSGGNWFTFNPGGYGFNAAGEYNIGPGYGVLNGGSMWGNPEAAWARWEKRMIMRGLLVSAWNSTPDNGVSISRFNSSGNWVTNWTTDWGAEGNGKGNGKLWVRYVDGENQTVVFGDGTGSKFYGMGPGRAKKNHSIELGKLLFTGFDFGTNSNTNSIYTKSYSNNFGFLNYLSAQALIWGAATEISVSGPRPIYTGAGDWMKMKVSGKLFAKRLSYLGAAITLYDIWNDSKGNGVNISTSNGLDLFFTGLSLTGVGAIPSGVYFGINILTLGITGKDIGEHIDSYYWIPNPNCLGCGFVPIGKKSGY